MSAGLLNTASVVSQLTPYRGGARGVMVIVVGNGHNNTSSNPNTNALRKGMNPIILPPAMGK